MSTHATEEKVVRCDDASLGVILSSEPQGCSVYCIDLLRSVRDHATLSHSFGVV